MKIVIPYREHSERCHNKNTKPFIGQQSILDLTIDQFKGHDIVLAAIHSDTTEEIAKRHNAERVDLSPSDSGWSDLNYEISQKIKPLVSKDEPICFWLATEITFFINHTADDLITHGMQSLDDGFDSTMVVRPFKHFLLNNKFKPDNFNAGAWHPYSQDLDPKFTVTILGITTQQTMEKYRYVFGPNANPFIANQLYVDIDTEEEFKIAQILWKAFAK